MLLKVLPKVGWNSCFLGHSVLDFFLRCFFYQDSKDFGGC